MDAIVGFVVIGITIAFVVMWSIRRVPQHAHEDHHWHPNLDRRLDAIESVLKIDRAAGAAELEMFFEVMKQIRGRQNGTY